MNTNIYDIASKDINPLVHNEKVYYTVTFQIQQ